jgi:dTDP-glucose 4,6-dehydratase
MNNALVTGGAGFIGSNFCRYLLGHDNDVEVVNLDLLTYAGSLENLRDLETSDRYHFVQGDICDGKLLDQIFERYDIDTVVHFAAESHVDRSIAGPAPFVRTNIQGTFALLESARSHWQTSGSDADRERRFHHISTDEVYGSLAPGDPAFTETSPYQPNSPYAASKASSDHLVRSYFHTYGLPTTITNCSNNYGPYQFPEKLIPLIITNAINNRPLPVYGDGQQIRDWLHVEDHCEAIGCVLERGEPGETYNIGGNNQPTNLEIVERICSILDARLDTAPQGGYQSLIEFVTDRPGHDRRYAMNIGKIHSELGWQPRNTLQEGLGRTVEWYLSHGEWLDEIRSRPSYADWIDAQYPEGKRAQ